MGCLTVIGIGIAMSIGIVVIVGISSSSNDSKTPSVPQRGALVSIVGSSCPAMRSEALWKDMQSSIKAGDTKGATKTLLSRGGRLLEPGTPVMIKDVSVFAGCAEVTLQGNGPDMGEKWFVALDCLPK